MGNNEFNDKCFWKIMSLINKNKPAFGNLSVTFFFHQEKLTKVQLLSKMETLIFEKNEEKKEQN